jgi:H+/gluconate symporter-like permease
VLVEWLQDSQPKPRFIYDISRYSVAADRPGQRAGAGRLDRFTHQAALLALLIVSVGVGFATGMAPGQIVKQLTNGAGKTLGAVGVVIALGPCWARSWPGITEQIAEAILRHLDRMIPWAMTLVAFIVGIPMFFEVGLVVMLPLIFSVARKLLEARPASRARPMSMSACR